MDKYGRTEHSTSADRFSFRADLSDVDFGANRTCWQAWPHPYSSQRRGLGRTRGPGHSIFVVISGELEAVRPTGTIETHLLIVRAVQFTGEINILSGRSAMARIRARQDGEIVQLARESFLTLVQTDAELSEILMRAFILRRVELLDLTPFSVPSPEQ